MQREQWHLTEGLIFLHFAVFILSYAEPEQLGALALVPGQVLAKPWSVLTFQFIHGGMLGFFFSMLVLWIMGRPLEDAWGSPRFLLFWLASVLGASGTAVALGQPLAGDVFLETSLLFTFATVYPDTEFRIWFVLPVKVKWLAIIGGVLLLLSSLRFGLLAGLANAVGMSTGYVLFLLVRRFPSRRKVAFELKKRRTQVVVAAQNAVVERRNLAWDGRVRAAAARARERATVAEEDRALLAELDAARDPSITVCAPQDFGFVGDPVCRSCPGYAECSARRVRMAANEGKSTPG
jgi:membrane associated rhomboid family serine protease